MNPQRTKQISDLFLAALDCAPTERAAFLAQACAGDAELQREVESLLAADEQAASFLEAAPYEAAAAALADEQDAAMLGRQLGPYRIQRELGHGGMGVVYLALDTRLDRLIAIKALPAAFTQDQDRVRRFIREAKAASALNHPNIITIHEIGQENGAHYIATEFIDGQTLRRQAQGERLKLSTVLDVGIQIASALAAAHEAGIVHRDIKPENVMLRRDGIVKVLDFGLAKLTEPPAVEVDSAAPTLIKATTDSGVVLGTASYMSPEQARGQKVDARSDIFALGVVLYELTTGRRPFAGATMVDVLAALLEREPAPLRQYAPEAPAELQRIVALALRKDREERYQHVRDLLRDLQELKQELELDARAHRPAGETAVSSSEQITLETAPTSAPVLSGGKLRVAKRGAALALLLIAVAAAVYFGFFRRQAIDSLAVLPFVNVGANPEAEYLSDGVTDGLINSLAQASGLKVMSRNSVFRYKGKEGAAQEAGKTLGVRAVLTGKVLQRGDDLIVSAELVDVRDNSHLWGAQYNHKMSDLLAVQAALARDLAEKLRLKLSSAEQQRLTKRGTENAAAYELYLKGRYALNSLTEEGIQKSAKYFQQAIEQDPRYSAAYAGLAEYYSTVAYAVTTSAVSPKEAHAQAKDAALKAVQFDDTLAEAHNSLALVAMLQEWDWPTAEREFRRALALNPNYVSARHWYSHFLVYQGRFAESLIESERGLALDPLDVGMTFHLGWHYYYARQYEQAVAQLQKALAMNQNHEDARSILGLAYTQQGRYEEARAELQKARELSNADRRDALGHLYAVSGQRDAAQKLLAELQAKAKHKYVSPYSLAKIYAGLDEPEQAFAHLEKAYAERDSNLTNVKVDPQFDRLRGEAHFAALLRRIGLVQ